MKSLILLVALMVLVAPSTSFASTKHGYSEENTPKQKVQPKNNATLRIKLKPAIVQSTPNWVPTYSKNAYILSEDRVVVRDTSNKLCSTEYKRDRHGKLSITKSCGV